MEIRSCLKPVVAEWFTSSTMHKVQIMTGTEPINEDGSPPHREAQTVKLEKVDKMVQIKKILFAEKLKSTFTLFHAN